MTEMREHSNTCFTYEGRRRYTLSSFEEEKGDVYLSQPMIGWKFCQNTKRVLTWMLNDIQHPVGMSLHMHACKCTNICMHVHAYTNLRRHQGIHTLTHVQAYMHTCMDTNYEINKKCTKYLKKGRAPCKNV